MKKLLLLSVLLIFACSSDDSSNDNNNNNNSGLLNCDGNPIPSIVYGSQEWTVENACHITYRDGTPIPQVIDNNQWANLTTGAWCYYDNDPNKGKLYNWYAVIGIHDNDDSTPNKDFAPEGWHVPNNDQFTTLINYLVDNGYESFQDETVDNTLAKSMASATGWECDFPGTDTTYNSSGFNAFPISYRAGWSPTTSPNGLEGFFLPQGQQTYFWCYEVANWQGATDLYYSTSLNIQCYLDSVQIGSSNKTSGLSVRLVKD